MGTMAHIIQTESPQRSCLYTNKVMEVLLEEKEEKELKSCALGCIRGLLTMSCVKVWPFF